MVAKLKRLLIGIVVSVGIILAFLVAFYGIQALTNWFGWQLPLWLLLSLSLIIWFGLAGLSSFLFLNEQNQFTTSKRILKEMAKGNFNFDGSKDANRLRSIDRDWNDFFDQMNQTNRSLARMEVLKQEFISNVSHEIRSPLTSIVGFSQLAMVENSDIEKRQHYLQTIQDEAIRLSELSDSLMKLTALEESEQLLEKSDFSLASQLRQVLQGTASQFQAKEISVTTDLEELTYFGDRELIYQIWQNIISNSLKFSHEKGELSVSLKRQGDSFQVIIADNGIGLKVEDQERIFERFYKADASRSAKTGGSGLGLSIVAKISELHGDLLIDVESEGQGTRFIVSGPLS